MLRLLLLPHEQLDLGDPRVEDLWWQLASLERFDEGRDCGLRVHHELRRQLRRRPRLLLLRWLLLLLRRWHLLLHLLRSGWSHRLAHTAQLDRVGALLLEARERERLLLRQLCLLLLLERRKLLCHGRRRTLRHASLCSPLLLLLSGHELEHLLEIGAVGLLCSQATWELAL